MLTRALLAAAIGVCVLLPARGVQANPEPAARSARALGMGGVGTSLLGDGAAVFHNPAGLDDVERYTISGSLTPVLVTTRTPWAGPGTETRGEPILAPLFDFGAGLRLSPWFVIGLGAYAATGFGNTYENVAALGGEDVEVTAFSAELSLPLVFRLMPGLSVGAGPRLAIASLSSSTLTPMPLGGAEPTFVRSDVSMSGASPLGFQVGVRYRINPVARVGLNYRSAMSVEISGTTETQGMEFDSESEYDTPHAFRFGVDFSLLEERLILAVDARYMQYSLSHEVTPTTIEVNGVEMTSEARLLWQDSFGVMLGAEYLISPKVPVRLGFNFTPSATPDETANPFVPVPATTYVFGTGAGLRYEHVDLDLALMYTVARTDVETGMSAGSYETQSFLLSLSASYHR